MSDPTPTDEERAAARVGMMGGIRLIGALLVIVGIAITQGQLSANYWLGLAIAVAGLFGFFFAPTMMVRRWKKQDRERGE